MDELADRGYVVVRGAIPREIADECCERARAQLGVPDGPPWPGAVLRGPLVDRASHLAATAPALVDALASLLAGEEWIPPQALGNLVVRLPSGPDPDPAGDPGDTGWHVDASIPGPDPTDYLGYRVNHRSQGRALTLLCLLSDTGPDDAPTRLLVGSHRALARALAPFGDEGVAVVDAPYPEPAGPVELATGAAGDVYVCHPFLVHAATWPHRGERPRYLAQPAVALVGGMAPGGVLDVESVAGQRRAPRPT